MSSRANTYSVVWASQEASSLPHRLHGSAKGDLMGLFYWANNLGELMPVEGGGSQKQTGDSLS